MNSKVQVLVKLEYVFATCETMLQLPGMAHVYPTLMWMKLETGTVYERILSTCEPKKKISFLKQAKRVTDHIRTLQADREQQEAPDVTEEEGYLFLISTLTQMLEDINDVKSMKVFMIDLITAAYTAEELIEIPRDATFHEDEIRSRANKYLSDIYGKMDQYI